MGLRYSTHFDPQELFNKEPPNVDGVDEDYVDDDLISLREYDGWESQVYCCRHCHTHISALNFVMSRNYRGRGGEAYLVDRVANTIDGAHQVRSMITGHYLVCDIMCHQCRHVVGWKYIKAEDRSQKFKEGKYVVEMEATAIAQ